MRFELSDIQARAIVEMRLRQLTGLEQDKLRAEFDELIKLIADLKDILDNEGRRMEIIKNELLEIRDKYGDERRSTIEYSASEMRIEDLIPDEEVVVTISHAGYIKRTSLAEYKVPKSRWYGIERFVHQRQRLFTGVVRSHESQLSIDLYRKREVFLDACV